MNSVQEPSRFLREPDRLLQQPNPPNRGPRTSGSELADSGGRWREPKVGLVVWKLSWPFVIRALAPPKPSRFSLHQLGKAKSSWNPLYFQRASIGLTMAINIKKGRLVFAMSAVASSIAPTRDQSAVQRRKRQFFLGGLDTNLNPARDAPKAPEAPDARSCGEHSHTRRARHRATGRALSPHRSRRDADSSIHSHAQSGPSARKPDAPRQSRLPPQMQRQLRWRRR